MTLNELNEPKGPENIVQVRHYNLVIIHKRHYIEFKVLHPLSFIQLFVAATFQKFKSKKVRNGYSPAPVSIKLIYLADNPSFL